VYWLEVSVRRTSTLARSSPYCRQLALVIGSAESTTPSAAMTLSVAALSRGMVAGPGVTTVAQPR